MNKHKGTKIRSKSLTQATSSMDVVRSTVSNTKQFISTLLYNRFISPTDDADLQMKHVCMYENRLLYIVYAVSSFMYCLLGLVILFKADKLTEQLSSFWPWRLEGTWLIPQGIISYMSDAHTLGEISYWHPIDRATASCVIVANIWRIALLVSGDDKFSSFPNCSFAEPLIVVSGVISLIGWKLSLTYCVPKEERKMMMFHCVWHYILPAVAVYLFATF